jgi:hypothetical protein
MQFLPAVASYGNYCEIRIFLQMKLVVKTFKEKIDEQAPAVCESQYIGTVIKLFGKMFVELAYNLFADSQI